MSEILKEISAMNLKERSKKNIESRLKFGPYLTIYNKDYIKKKLESQKGHCTTQEFEDPLCEGFKNYLTIDENAEEPLEACDDYLEKVKKGKPKIGKIYFEQPVDKIIVKGDQLLNGKSVYQVDYCDIEAEIRRKLLEKNKKKYSLPVGWKIPLTTQSYDFRPPLLLSEHAMDQPLIIKAANNLGQNEKINQILNVKTGDSEYNEVIGKLGNFVVTEQMHGKIDHPDCGCLQHRQMKEFKQ